ncbi:MAG TPA: heat-inducible transcription repressor HrcA [Leptospiraceae bacterium]|nr:heat-inducible transcription repressor HrcA [Spirochaetaceae bacterium]HBS06993.1 heat-inducible transcription repressor HrcA [Leptospiraceae bacterium]
MAGKQEKPEAYGIEAEDLSPRQADILRLVVDTYIEGGQPVSSLGLVDRYDVGLSSASIRHILSDLEKYGYLYGPHRSSGRVPTEKAYRFYVASLPGRLPPANFAEEKQRFIQKEYLRREFSIREILEVTSNILSALTNFAGVIIGPAPERAVLKHIELIDMGQDEVLVVIATRSGTVYTKTLFVEERIPRDYLLQISRFLNEKFKGHDLDEVHRHLLGLEIPGERELSGYYQMLSRILNAHFESVKGKEEFFISGLDRLIDQYGSVDLEKIRDLGKLYEAKDMFHGIFKQTVELDDVMVRIEGDQEPRLAGLSVLAGSYKMGEKTIGAMGIVGPNRMNYVDAIRTIEYLRILISGLMTRMSN